MFGPLLALAAYLLGSVSFGLLIAARRGVDLRATGSGNTGATNVRRALGAPTGRAVLVLDALKGLLPAAIARVALGADDPWTAAAGLCAVLGHVLPVWHGFRGGKGAATAAGVLVGVVPPAGAVALVTYAVLKRTTRRASVGSLGGGLAATATVALLEGASWPTAMAASVFAVLLLRHAGNLRRLLRGEEPPS